MSVYLVPGELQAILFEAKAKGHKNLFLNYQHLSQIPQELLELRKAEKLYLKYNILQELPSDIWKLERLVELYLHSNHLQALPEEIGKLHSLKSLNISNNELRTIPSTIGHMTNLENLHLANNLLTCLPKSLGTNLHSLKVLDIMNNDLTLLPWQLCYCRKLETLSFDGNKVEWIPRQLTRLEHLQELSGSRNQLTFIPQDIDGMLSLESLLLDSNRNLTALPATILRLPQLSILGTNRCGENREHPDLGERGGKPSKYFPEAKFIGSSRDPVLPLTELCLRTVYKLFYVDAHLSSSNLTLPGCLATLLQSPMGHCFHCQQPFFLGLFMYIAEGQRATKVVHWSVRGVHARLVEAVNLDLYFTVCSLECYTLIQGLFIEE